MSILSAMWTDTSVSWGSVDSVMIGLIRTSNRGGKDVRIA